MKRIVFDSYAMLVLFQREKGHEEITQLLSDIAANNKEGFICVINLGEIYYIAHRKQGVNKADLAIRAIMHFNLHIVDADYALTMEAARIKARHKLSYADAFAAALTIKKKATLITGDKEFKQLEGEANFKVKFI